MNHHTKRKFVLKNPGAYSARVFRPDEEFTPEAIACLLLTKLRKPFSANLPDAISSICTSLLKEGEK